MIIKFFDSDDSDYPLIEIKEEHYLAFESTLKAYKKDEEYNIDDFISILKSYNWFVRAIYPDKEVFF